ncbi:helix-turn-helix domain-containing protein [Mesorhizobium sp. IMUNJ 23232]|uniref:helix-turn-helix domain-containing protein n=1 Tax=Mesorhizobium sp. IMUNJ 23232 TaxID=3376064 RepID=UPI0037A58266
MAPADEAFRQIRFSTGELPPGRRLDAFREMLTRATGNLDVKATRDWFDFGANTFVMPGLGIAHIASDAVRIARTREMDADGARDLVLVVVHEGTATATQRGREVIVQEGGAFLASSHDTFFMERTAARLTNYSLLGSDLAPAIASLDDALLNPIPSDAEAMRLLTGYTDLVFKGEAPISAESSRLAVSHVHDLIALALGATRDAAEIAKARGLPAARQADLYARALRLIALRSDEPDLAPAEMAQQLKVSLRLLQKLFAERGETIMNRLWEERVNRAARLLAEPETADRSITDIAFSCGFNDSAHFSRVFAAHKGTAPSRWRKQVHDQPALNI